MTDFIQSAQANINRPDVIAAMQTLSKYGLGVMLPHLHQEDDGEFSPLPLDMVSCERDLKVSFHSENALPAGETVAVAWRWDTKNGAVKVFGRCSAQGCEGM